MRPKIDRDRKYKRVRVRDTKQGDAVSIEKPVVGGPYFRVTAKGGEAVKVATKKREDLSRAPQPIPVRPSGYVYLIERTVQDVPTEDQPTPRSKGKAEGEGAETQARATEALKDPKFAQAKFAVQVITANDSTTITVVRQGKPLLIANDSHPNFENIRNAVLNPETEAEDLDPLFSVARYLAEKFSRLTERVTVRSGKVLFDNDPVNDGVLTRAILNELGEDDETRLKALVGFFEKVQMNPSQHSRDQLYTFLDANDCSLTPDGDIIAFKSVNADGTSIPAGPGIGNGEEMNGHLPNEVGSTIEMPRSQVADSPHTACSSGLHVGAWNYVTTWSGSAKKVFIVHVSPRDVVSVPHDHSAQKVRVCRYNVVEEVPRGKKPEIKDAIPV